MILNRSIPTASIPIFAADYTTGSIDAQIAGGSPLGTFTNTCSTSNPKSYIDASGVMQPVTASNTPRFAYKAYGIGSALASWSDGSACKLMLESASTQYMLRSTFDAGASGSLPTSWSQSTTLAASPTLTLTDVTSLFNFTGARELRIEYTGQAGDSGGKIYQVFQQSTAGSYAQNDRSSSSFMIKGTVSAGVTVAVRVVGRSSSTVYNTYDVQVQSSLDASNYKRFSSSGILSGNVLIDRSACSVVIGNVTPGATVDLTICLGQNEKKSFATSFIPTTTASLTRNVETLSYLSSGNRGTATETIVLKYTPMWQSSVAGSTTAYLLDSDADSRYARFNRDATANMTMAGNITDSPTSTGSSMSVSSFSKFDNMTIGLVFDNTDSPYYQTWRDGGQVSSYSDINFSTPTFGTNTYIGTDNSGTLTCDGYLSAVQIFNQLLSTNQHSRAYLTSNGKININA